MPMKWRKAGTDIWRRGVLFVRDDGASPDPFWWGHYDRGVRRYVGFERDLAKAKAAADAWAARTLICLALMRGEKPWEASDG